MTLEEHLTSLQSSYIWNIYKQLTNEMLEKAAELPYSELEKNFKKQIMEPLADTILTKTMINLKGLTNKKISSYPKFKLIFGNSVQSFQEFI